MKMTFSGDVCRVVGNALQFRAIMIRSSARGIKAGIRSHRGDEFLCDFDSGLIHLIVRLDHADGQLRIALDEGVQASQNHGFHQLGQFRKSSIRPIASAV